MFAVVIPWGPHFSEWDATFFPCLHFGDSGLIVVDSGYGPMLCGFLCAWSITFREVWTLFKSSSFECCHSLPSLTLISLFSYLPCLFFLALCGKVVFENSKEQLWIMIPRISPFKKLLLLKKEKRVLEKKSCGMLSVWNSCLLCVHFNWCHRWHCVFCLSSCSPVSISQIVASNEWYFC